MDDILDLVTKARSIRRFRPAPAMTEADLRGLVELARRSPSAGNKQTLRFRLVCGAEACAAVYPALRWAGYFADWDGPAPEERPTGYVVMLRDARPGASVPADEGIAAQSIFLGAAARGWGGCFIGNVDRPALARALGLDAPAFADYQVALVIALGKPLEQAAIEPLPADGSIKYWRDAAGGHHVPKRALDEIIV